MKKYFAIFVAFMMLVAVPAFAVNPDPGPGWYYHEHTGAVKYFEQGHVQNSGQDWKVCPTSGPVCSFANGPINLQQSSSTAVASPLFINGGISNTSGGGWSVGAGGNIEVNSFAQGTRSADTMALATGIGIGIGGAAGIETDHFGFGVSGAFAGAVLYGGGMGLGIDNFNFRNNPDYASVGIDYSGRVGQGNGILVSNGQGTWAGGNNQTGATFSGGSFNQSNLSGLADILLPALAIGATGGGAYAGGFTVAGYVDCPNFAAANSKTVGFSGYVADQGTVYGTGTVGHQAVVGSQGGSMGLTGGSATFSYEGTGNLGYGTAQTGGWTKIQNTGNSSAVTSFSSGSASATTTGR